MKQKMMKPLVSIQILNWNRAEETQIAIQSALNQSYKNIEIIVIDNGSTDESVPLTKKNFPDITLIELKKNYGCPGGRNLGIPYCNGDYIFFLDNDGVLHQDAVLNSMSTIESDSKIGIVAGVVYEFNDKSEIDSKIEIHNPNIFETNLFSGGISLHRKSIYNLVGFYPEHFMYGGEESFLSIKLITTNYRIVKDESVVLWHKGSDEARDKSRETLSGYFNKLYIAFTLYPIKELSAFLIYFLFKYPYYAKKEGIWNQFKTKFKKDFFNTIKIGLRDRNPITPKDFNRYKKKGINEQRLRIIQQ
tara:strand:+ start:14260 stop:15171 length:912 start_codon:yes stop_codon:yes gene_type:complete